MAQNDKQLHTMRHMLGINTPYDAEPEPYRNYAAVAPGGDQHEMMKALEEDGLVEERECSMPGSDLIYYSCTDEGVRVAMESHQSIQMDKPKRVYK